MAQKQEEEQLTLQTRKSLQKYIKEKEDFFGGKVKTSDKKELYNYITSGGFAEEVYSNVANVADAANVANVADVADVADVAFWRIPVHPHASWR